MHSERILDRREISTPEVTSEVIHMNFSGSGFASRPEVETTFKMCNVLPLRVDVLFWLLWLAGHRHLLSEIIEHDRRVHTIPTPALARRC